MAQHNQFGDDQGRRNHWLQFGLLVGVALVVLCLLTGDQVDCRPKADKAAKKDDGDSSKSDHAHPAKDGAGDDDKKDEKAIRKEVEAEKEIEKKSSYREEEDEDEDEDEDGESKKKEETKNSSKKAAKEIKTITKVTTTTTSAPKSTRGNSTSTAAPDKHEKKGGKKHGNYSVKAHHRVSGGFQESDVPGYLATLWQPEYAARRGPDGRYAGNGILVGDERMLIHSESKAKIDQKGDLPPSHDEQDPARIPKEDVIFDNPASLNIDGISTRKKYRDLESIKTGIGGSPFGLYKIKNKTPITLPGYPSLPNKYPTLEHDYNNYGQDCNAYGWSRNMGAADSDSGGAGGSSQQRPFVKFPVEHDPGSCNRGHCELSSDHGSICDGLGDHGTPVLCGSKKVLTYIIKGVDGGSDGTGCRRGNIPAFHVGSMIDELKDHVPGISHT